MIKEIGIVLMLISDLAGGGGDVIGVSWIVGIESK